MSADTPSRISPTHTLSYLRIHNAQLDIAEADDFAVPVGPRQERPDRCISMDKMIATPGLLHIIHNASNDLLKVMTTLDAAVSSLAVVCRFLGSPHFRPRIVATCFSSNLSHPFAAKMGRFSCHVNKDRWGTVAFACAAVLDLQLPLRRFWDLETYQRGAGRPQQQDASDLTQIGTVDEALCSAAWWAHLLTLEALCSVVRDCFVWAEGAHATTD
jgi:hypothetical protein